MANTRTRNRGFTLIEILLVVLILVMLGGVAIVVFGPTREGANKDIAKTLIGEISTAVDLFSMHMGRYPTEDEGLGALRSKPEESEDDPPNAAWRGPYLKKEPKDPWGQPIVYKTVESGSEEWNQGLRFKLSSNGPEKTPDNEDDIKNWDDAESGV